jgi:transposase
VGYDGFKNRKGSKIHAVVDPSSMPLHNNEHDSRRLQELVDSLSGRPNIPVNPRNGRRPRPYNVERFFGWLKSFRRILIRYERLAVTYRAFIKIACIMIHLRHRS